MKNKGDGMIHLLSYIVILSGALMLSLPFLWLIFSTFKGNEEIIQVPPTFFPGNPTLFNYREILEKFNIFRHFLNSVFLSATKTFIALYISLYCGYVLGKIMFKGQKIIFAIVLFTMMIPYLIMVIPLYDMINTFNWMDRYIAIIIPTVVSPFGVFMMRQYTLSSIPDELLEAAGIDGAGDFFIFHRIVVPLSVNMLSALGIFLFLWNWEDFLWPYLVLITQAKFPLAVALNLFSGQNVVNYGPLFAATFVAIVPIVVVYLFFQRNFVEGIAMTGIK